MNLCLWIGYRKCLKLSVVMCVLLLVFILMCVCVVDDGDDVCVSLVDVFGMMV